MEQEHRSDEQQQLRMQCEQQRSPTDGRSGSEEKHGHRFPHGGGSPVTLWAERVIQGIAQGVALAIQQVVRDGPEVVGLSGLCSGRMRVHAPETQ